MKSPWAPEMFGLLAYSLLALGALFGLLFLLGPAGRRFVHPLFGIAGAWILLLLIFFRDPERLSSADASVLLAPADGRILAVEMVPENQNLGGPARRIATFMHVGNVHVQRLPADGTLLWVKHVPGKFYPVLDKRASARNEQRWYAFESPRGKFTVVQIAGILARRTIAWIQPERAYSRGERMGMIAFGSEVDVYLPLSVEVLVKPGEVVRAGKTPLGRWKP